LESITNTDVVISLRGDHCWVDVRIGNRLRQAQVTRRGALQRPDEVEAEARKLMSEEI
jgi:hypothetical protein